MPSKDPDIRHEPHLRPDAFEPNHDPAIDAPLGFDSRAVQFSSQSEEDIDHSVWDEPSLVPNVAAATPKSALTYANWLNQRRESWSQFNGWAVTMGVVMASIPCAAAAAIISWTSGNIFMASDIIVACALAPMLQEICKIAVPLWIVEKRPYFFTTWFQFFVVALATATVFAVISNSILSLVVPEVTRGIFLFQWIGVLGVNLVTASIATFGLETIWRKCIHSGKPPKLEHGYPYFATAIGIHIAFAIGTTVWFLIGGFGRFIPL